MMPNCPTWPPPAYTPRGYLLVIAYGGVNQQTSQVSDALVLGHALRAHVIVPERLVHHFWNDSLRVPELLDIPHWRRSAAAANVHTVAPEELTGDVAAWYAQCGRKGDLPDSGKESKACARFHVALPRGGTVRSARDAILPMLRRYGMVAVNTLKRLHEPMLTRADGDPMGDEDLATSMLFVHAHFVALREHREIRKLVGRVLRKLPSRFVAVHLRQELDILAISGCIGPSDPHHATAERIIANWGGWGSKPLRGAVALRQRFHNSTELMRANGKCGVSATAVAELLTALQPGPDNGASGNGADGNGAGGSGAAGTFGAAGPLATGSLATGPLVPPRSAVYVCGQRDGLEPLAAAGFAVWTQRDVLSASERTRWGGHASFLGLVDAAISTRAAVYVAAKGNFDRSVTAKRELRGKGTIDSHGVYFAGKRAVQGFRRYVRQTVRMQQLALAARARGAVEEAVIKGVPKGPRTKKRRQQVYDDPLPTVQACGARLDRRWGRLGQARVAAAAAEAMIARDAESDAEEIGRVAN